MQLLENNVLRLVREVDPRTKGQQVIHGIAAAMSVKGASDYIGGPMPGEIALYVPNHHLRDGDRVFVVGVGGCTNANNSITNPSWEISVIDADNFALTGSVFGPGAYTTGGYCVPGMVGAVDGARFSAERIVDIYNRAREVVYKAFRERQDSDNFIGGLHTTAALAFTLSGSECTASLPTDYADFIALFDRSLPPAEAFLLPNDFLSMVKGSTSSHFYQTASNLHVFEREGRLVHYGTWMDGSTWDLHYYKLQTYVASDLWLKDVGVLPVYDPLNRKAVEIVIEVGAAIASEQGMAEVNRLAKLLVKGA